MALGGWKFTAEWSGNFRLFWLKRDRKIEQNERRENFCRTDLDPEPRYVENQDIGKRCNRSCSAYFVLIPLTSRRLGLRGRRKQGNRCPHSALCVRNFRKTTLRVDYQGWSFYITLQAI